MGRWWSRKGEEIDILAVDEDTDEILFAEVKWRNRPVGIDLYDDLVRKSKLVQWRKNERSETVLIVSKSGFTDGLTKRSKKDMKLSLWDLKEIERKIVKDQCSDTIQGPCPNSRN